MPLYAGVITAPPAVVVTNNPVWSEDVGTMYATWTDPTGVEWPLSDIAPERGYFTTPGIAGWGAQPFEIVTDPMSRGGESVRYIRPKPARLTWPVHIWGETHLEFVTRYRAVKRAFLMTVHRQQPGWITVSRPDGSARSIAAYYEDGLAGEAHQNWLSASPAITLFCPDGAWRDTIPITERRGSAAAVNFLNPFPQLSSSQVLGLTDITNPGDIVAWPTWTITGPCTAVTATNHATNESFTLTTTLGAGETATITTDRPTVRGNAGQNLSGALNWPTATLWGLLPGVNGVEFIVAGSGSGSAVELSFYPRYEGA